MKIVIAGNYGAKNLGDEMILEGLLESLKSVVPSGKITVLSGDPEETISKYGGKYSVKSFEKFPAGFRSLISGIFKHDTKTAVKNCDYFILGGGGLFNDMSLKANIIWAVQAFMAYFYKKPVIMYGQSVGPIQGFFIKKIVKKLFQKAKLVAVRDEDSKEQLKNLGVTKPIYVIPDMAFNTGLINNIPRLPVRQAGLPTLKMVVALRQFEKTPKNFKKTLIEFFTWLVEEKGMSLDFVDFQSGKEGDGVFTEEILSTHGALAECVVSSQFRNSETPYPNQSDRIKHLSEVNSANEILKIFLNAGFVFGMRLHSIITAIKTHTPFMAVNYSGKVGSLLKSHKLEEFVVDFTTGLEEMKGKFLKLEKEHSNISNKLKETAEKALKDHLKAEKLLKKALLSRSQRTSYQ